MNERNQVIVILSVGVLVSLFLTLMVSVPMGHRHGMIREWEIFPKIKVFVSSLNIILISALLWNYTTIYRNIPNRFTLSLIIFSIALFLYAFLSNPLIHTLFGFGRAGPGPFTFLPDLFATVAIVILLYQSYK